MVWFQCEDCGDNLKKPKLPNHFRTCSATKLSCIDCGQTFGQESVQGHTQCITEAEKYGPKGQGKASNGATPKNNKDLKQQSSVDVNVGLSERSPWFCSLCNTKATSKQALLTHAEGKRHRAKARAFLVASGQSQQIDNSVPGSDGNGTTPHGKVPEQKVLEEPQVKDLPKVDEACKMVTDNVSVSLKKKRKIDPSENDDIGKKLRDDTPAEGDKGEVIQVERTTATEIDFQSKEGITSGSKSRKEDSKKKIKWKKLITSTLRNNPDGIMKIKKVRKLVLKAVQESGVSEDETHLKEVLELKINSSSKFVVDKKFVQLAVKD